jgi:hypothetical protein
MLGWQEFDKAARPVAKAGTRLLKAQEVAFLATTSATGRPRIHPFVPRVVDCRLVAFIMDSSPIFKDLCERKQYSIHAQPGPLDEEFFVSGEAIQSNCDRHFRLKAETAMGFATGIDDHHILFEFKIDRALWTTWVDFATENHRPKYTRWRFS